MSGKIGAPDLSAKILALRNDLKIYSDTNLKRVIDGVRQDPTRFAVLRYYRIETLQRQLDTLSGKIEPAWQGFFRKVADHLVSYRAAEGYDRIFLTPTSRFLIQLLLTVARNPGKMLDELKADDGQVVSSDFKSRRTIIANRFDPLDKTVRGFGIKRFLTTNYDFEVERFFQDIGYRRLEHESDIEDSFVGPGRFDRGDYRVDGLGGSFRDLTFKAETASDLITFAIGNDNTDAAVYHLHGRATIDDPLVITERNYMDMYIRDDPQRVLVNESITMAFASAPILFLGLGMDESDVLRPLRQFMSDRDRSMGYTGMVLMPADKHIDARSKFASSLYLRYGVHTIFYGSGTMEITTLDDPPREVALDWLHRITALIIALDKSAKRIEDNISKELEAVKDDSEYATEANTRKLVLSKIGDVLKAEEGEALFSKLKKAVGKLGGDLAIDGNTEDSCALGLLFGKLESTGKFSLAELRAAGEIKSCKLTSQRPLKTGTGPLKPNRQNSYPLADYVNFYLDMLSDVMHMSLDGFNRRASLLGIRRSLAARRATLDGVRNALLTATMNAAMEALEKEWRAWRIDWQTSPPHRRPLIEELPFRPSAPEAKMILPRRYVRHQVINAISNMEKAESSFCSSLDDPISSKFCNSSPTNIRSFDTWISALHAQRTKDMEALSPNANANQRGLLGRRMNTVAAQTGVGKGTFFSVFSTKLGLSSYIEAVYPHSTHYKNNPRPIFAAAFFLNFSFSTELASIYDMVREKLLDIVSWQNAIIMLLDKSSGMAIKSVEEHLPKLIALGPDHAFSQTKELIEAQNAWRAKFILDHRKLSRAAVLDILFKKFTNTSVGIADLTLQLNQQIIPRILICLNACELLFRPDRIPKNVEIADMLLSLGSDRTKNLPIDFVAVGSLRRLGLPWRMPRTEPLEAKSHPTVGRSSTITLKHRNIQRADIKPGGIGTIENLKDRSGLTFVDANGEVNDVNNVYFARTMNPTRLLVDNFQPLAAIFLLGWLRGQGQIVRTAAPVFRDQQSKYFETVLDKWGQMRTPNADTDLVVMRTKRDEAIEQSIKADLKAYRFMKSRHHAKKCFSDGMTLEAAVDSTRTVHAKNRNANLSDLLFDRYKSSPSQADEDEWRAIREALAGNRYCLTILLAAAQEMALAEASWEVGCAKAHAFIRATVDKVQNVSTSLREQIVLQATMDTYRALHKIGCPLRDVELHHHLIRHIAVINSPLSAGILKRLPAIGRYFDSIGEVDDPILSRKRSVAAALISLGERGLVFRLSPHFNLVHLEKDGAEKEQEIKQYRFALHRLVQRYCISKLGSVTFEPVRVNDFGPSLASSMPSNVPRLSHEAYRFLRELMVGLSQYPDVAQSSKDDPRWLFAKASRNNKVQALRAAMSMIRSVFSIAVVSRFEDYKSVPGERERRARGYFEIYKVRLRWVLRKAWELHVPSEDGLPYQPDAIFKQINALYRDEIVWLYNEVGITCLVQGNLDSAVVHLRQAAKLNREIEGKEDTGRQQSIIFLNLAVAQLERGRIEKARERLLLVMEREGDLRDSVYHLCEGYLGLIAHLSGHRTKADTMLTSAEAFFVGRGDVRASSIFRNHLARLAKDRDVDRVLLYLKSARENAESGGHEDVRHHILVSQVNISQFMQKAPHERRAQDMATLGEIEDYAKIMGIPSLTCDANHSRARIMLDNGDNTTSGQILIKAMALARRNGLMLRLNAMMTTYARVLIRRERQLSAQRLLYASLEMAKRSHYNLEVDRIQSLLQEWRAK